MGEDRISRAAPADAKISADARSGAARRAPWAAGLSCRFK
jgi:hypothetical protein